MITLCYAKGTAALAPHILLEDAGADYTARLVDFGAAEQQSADYLAINPKGRVPALITAEGTLTETPAILAYIAQIFPDANLAPGNRFSFAQAQAFNIYLAATVHVNHAHKQRGSRWTDDTDAQATLRDKVTANMTDCARIIEHHYLKGPWVMGPTYSMCDAYLFVITRWMKGDGVNLDDFPAISRHFSAMQERASVRKVMSMHM
ncbi:glutathione S-transferase family protein [Hoeflea sp. YIM 152468]|uniref:glutathione S-transferase family protein n=1 Tax=Hoeflea sp. YIM 152468 TaxID=3031759 RepID=UPI0023DA2853|nr:glutathione S-transferase family protein [Hoeflea sp. YIM 152468]MDF1609826.1 glutathione S-transferase family protein [Hoeflea sp. YIM 152468]